MSVKCRFVYDNAFFRTAFCLSAILSKTCFSGRQTYWGDAIVVLNRLDDGLLVTLLTKKVVAAQPLFLIDRHWKYKYLTCQKSAIKSVTKVLNNWFVRIDYVS